MASDGLMLPPGQLGPLRYEGWCDKAQSTFRLLVGEVKMYHHYASLGANCEGAFQVRRVLRRDESNFFSWNITTFEALISLLQSRFAGVMKVENLRYHCGGFLARDISHDYLFHSDFPRSPDIFFSDHSEILANHENKAQYLVSKFLNIANSDAQVAYFYKTDEEDVRSKAAEVYGCLTKLSLNEENVRLVVLQKEAKYEPDWNLPGISNRYLKRFAPFDDATDGHVLSWDRVFLEFPHQNGLNLAGF